jgi:hypothetical protein
MDGQHRVQPGQGQDPPDNSPRRRQQQLSAGLPGQLLRPAKPAQGMAVDEFQAGQVNDHAPPAGCDGIQ